MREDIHLINNILKMILYLDPNSIFTSETYITVYPLIKKELLKTLLLVQCFSTNQKQCFRYLPLWEESL